MKAIPSLVASVLLLTFAALAQNNIVRAQDSRAGRSAQQAAQEASPMLAALRPHEGEDFEWRFLKMMVVHHNAGIEMAELVGERAQSEELKAFARKSQKSQMEDNKKMTAWLGEEHEGAPDDNVIPEPSMAKMKSQMEILRKLKGKDFDKAFIPIMIDHHRGGVAMFELVDGRAKNNKLREFATNGAGHQRKEMEELEAMAEADSK